MRNVFFLLVLISFCTACNSNENTKPQNLTQLEKIANDSANFTQIEWIDSVANFGTINEGEIVEVTFKFKNIGNKPLYVIDVKPGCGCTSPSYSNEAIEPQKEGWVKGTFNSNNQKGEIHKFIRVVTNTINNKEYQLQFIGTVISKS
ncbi:MAG: DUF1573 domain-containing protein [Chitinophagales bacterium]|nr:DUF1573 domain-containing protein [Chitinophagales bacterium]